MANANEYKATAKALMEAQGLKPDRHNWMYSFMSAAIPATRESYYYSEIYLVGYCKQCDQTFTVLAPIDTVTNKIRLNRAGVPKNKCDWGGE